MKTVLTILLCLVFVGAGSVLGVDVKKKDSTTVAPGTDTLKTIDTAKQAEPKKKYDDFIDNNGNGIDDRKENLKKKVTPKPDSTKVQKKVSG